MVQRVRNTAMPEDVPLQQLDIQPPWTMTSEENARQFMIGDNNDNNSRVISFASPPCLELLSRSQEWFVDGNFDIAPPQFLQLYIVRVPLGEGCVTACYGLMQRKTQDSYSELFRMINNACVNIGLRQPQPQTVHCDFETASHNALRIEYPGVNIKGCFYHLTQVSNRIYNTNLSMHMYVSFYSLRVHL